MRIGTRSLNVVAWLSAATFAVVLFGLLANLCGVSLSADSERFKLQCTSGTLQLFTSSSHDSGVSFGVTGSGSPGPSQGTSGSNTNNLMFKLFHPLIEIPLWLPAACSLAVGVPSFVTLRRSARAIKNGACPKCGYMLTGLSPAAPCPECGRANPAPR